MVVIICYSNAGDVLEKKKHHCASVGNMFVLLKRHELSNSCDGRLPVQRTFEGIKKTLVQFGCWLIEFGYLDRQLYD